MKILFGVGVWGRGETPPLNLGQIYIFNGLRAMIFSQSGMIISNKQEKKGISFHFYIMQVTTLIPEDLKKEDDASTQRLLIEKCTRII